MTYSPPAIESTVELTAHCSGCSLELARCAPLWGEQRICCPDCEHGSTPEPED